MTNKKNIRNLVLVVLLVTFALVFLSGSSAHILIIADSKSDFPLAYQEGVQLANDLKSKGYEVVELFRSDATAENIIKGMYGADAVIYIGHGGFQTGNYDMNGGVAEPPFALVGSDDFIWGINGQMREGWNGKTFTAPLKPGAPVILLHSCFTTGWVSNKEVSNPTETIYNFALMFTSAGANYYASAWNGAEIIYDFLNGAQNFQEANNQNYEKITTYTNYQGVPIWRNAHGYAAFVGNWNGTFPTVAQTTPYDAAAAAAWYNSDRTSPYTPVNPPVNPPVSNIQSSFTISSAPYYINQAITFTSTSTSTLPIVKYLWNFGDGTSSTSKTIRHTFTRSGTYTVSLTVTDSNGQTSTSTKTITVNSKTTKPVKKTSTTTRTRR